MGEGQIADRLHKLVTDTPLLALINGQPDKVITQTYYDAGTADERYNQVVFSSPSLPGVSVTITFAYAGVSGGYYNTTITFS